MKKIVYAIAIAIGIISCNVDQVGYDLQSSGEAGYIKKNPKDSIPTDTIPTNPNDTIPTDDGGGIINNDEGDTYWGIPVKNNLIPVGEATATGHEWYGEQIFYSEKGDSLVRKADLPFTFELSGHTESESVTGEEPVYTGEKSMSANSMNTSYGEWESDGKGNMRRKVTNVFYLPTTEFSKTLTITHYEAYTVVNGRDHYYKAPTVSCSFNRLERSASNWDIVNDSIYDVTQYLMFVDVQFRLTNTNIKTYTICGNASVRYWTHMIEAETISIPVYTGEAGDDDY